MIRARLQNGAHCHNGCSDQDRLFPTELFRDGKGAEGPEKAADVVDGCDGRQSGSLRRSDQIVDLEKVLGNNHATCHASDYEIWEVIAGKTY